MLLDPPPTPQDRDHRVRLAFRRDRDGRRDFRATLGATMLKGCYKDSEGDAVLACVIPAGGARLEAGELMEHRRRHLASCKVPARFVVRDELPRTSIGNVAKAQPRDEQAGPAVPR